MENDKALLERLRAVKEPGYIRHTAQNTFTSNAIYWNRDGPAAADRITALLAERDAARAKRPAFPVLGSGGQSVDWQFVADHGKQAQANHYQSVKQLAARGGLSWSELHAVVHNRDWQKIDENTAIAEVRELEARYLRAIAGGTDGT